jgi:twitching motility protein PilT
MINYINENYNKHIITIEDPVEYIHPHNKSIVEQKEV